jgi:tetratricopeptide (TPR) repeat protein
MKKKTTTVASSPDAISIPHEQPLTLSAWGYALTIFISAFLLFQVQPIISKAILPWFGGTPGVWNTCLLFFQTLLFAGYTYSHLLTRYIPKTAQFGIHTLMLGIAVCLLPILPNATWKPTETEQPVWTIVQMLLANVGLPFFMLSTTGPLLQAWYGKTFPGVSPYRLYALSNAGSLLALLSYPFLVEPWLRLAVQSNLWSFGFVAFAFSCASVSWISLTRAKVHLESKTADETSASTAIVTPITFTTIIMWFLMAFTPSVMLLAATNRVCIDIASFPFLWILPLALYLLSFIICFENSAWYSRNLFGLGFLLSALAVVVMSNYPQSFNLYSQVSVFMMLLFCCAMVCHGELAILKPSTEHLTLYYLVMSAAGALGGAFVTFFCTRYFQSFFELPLAITLCLLVLLVAIWQPYDKKLAQPTSSKLFASMTTIVCLAVAILNLAIAWRTPDRLLHARRNFYGVLRVMEGSDNHSQEQVRKLVHGHITHGKQFLSVEKQRVPTSYYSEKSALGIALRNHASGTPRHIGVVGLGTGTIAAYGNEGDTFCFYEIDADVQQIAQEYFSFLKDSPAKNEIKLGDARLTLEAEIAAGNNNRYDLLVIDAFSSDAIPMHLLTTEAMGIYLQRTKKNGLIAIHISNRYLDLRSVVAALVAEHGAEAIIHLSQEWSEGAESSLWVLASKNADIFKQPAFYGFPKLQSESPVLWTDDYGSIVSVLHSPRHKGVAQSPAIKLYATGLDFYNKQNYVEAEKAFRTALQEDRENAHLWLHLGNTLRKQGDNNEAKHCFERSIGLNPRSSEALNNLGSVLLYSHPADAEKYVSTALKAEPRNAAAHVNMGTLLAEKGDYNKAIDHLEIAIAIDPKYELAKKNLEMVQSWRINGRPKSPDKKEKTGPQTR